MQSLKRKPESAKSFDLIKNEVEKKFKPNYDNRFGLKKDLNTVNNDYNYSEVEKSNHTRYFQKWRFKNRARFKRSLVSVFTLFVISFVSCGASDRPTEPDRLPFGVFPLNDVKWIETNHYGDSFTGLDSGYAGYYYQFYDTITYSVRQVGENKAELHRSIQKRMLTYDLYLLHPENLIADSTWNEKPELLGWIYLEGRKVYSQSIVPLGEKLLFYDFSLNIGDRLDIPYLYLFDFNGDTVFYYLVSIDDVRVGDELRKRYNFMLNSKSTNNDISIIEGIGGDNYFFGMFHATRPAIDPEPNYELIRVFYKDKLIWRRQ